METLRNSFDVVHYGDDEFFSLWRVSHRNMHIKRPHDGQEITMRLHPCYGRVYSKSPIGMLCRFHEKGKF